MYLVIFVRVCKSWKILLENWSYILLVDKIPIRTLGRYEGLRGYLTEAVGKSRFLVFDFGRTDSALDDYRYQLSYGGYVLPTVITAEGNLEHLILTGGKMCPDSYFEFLQFFELDRG